MSDQKIQVQRKHIYTDGSSSTIKNKTTGGWAWIDSATGNRGYAGVQNATSNAMELQAVIEAIKSNPGDLLILTDSSYVVNCFHRNWWQRWARNGWKTAKGMPVKNQNRWEELITFYKERDIALKWVKGHNGNKWNEIADDLARNARVSLQQR